ncbi:MAG: CHASE2 domain-containing protein [Cyclobacteriaceae bacterium]|nr:CHASE2 domain-containing protein [Cyclobacteriaceae bacterium]
MRALIVFIFFLIAASLVSCKKSTIKSEGIVIVDVADFGREIIAKQIAIIDSLSPKVVAIDLQFSTRKDERTDSVFASVLSRCDNLVMVSVINHDYAGEDIEYEELIEPLPEFSMHAKTGFANAILEDDEFQTLKRFSIRERVAGKTEYHFAVRTAMCFDSLRTMSFIQSNPKIIDVEYRGNTEAFMVFSAADVLERKITSKDIEGKIVLIGSFSPFDYDLFFTPISSKKKPHMPDMFGVVYLANIVAQILPPLRE